MNKITYLFGAGASRHALPIVDEIPDRLKKLIDLLETEEFKLDENSTFADLKLADSKTKYDYQKELIASLKWMLQESKSHASIDTFAKKLSIKRDATSLKKLKIAMSVFFIIEQILNKPDHRYDTFYSSILSDLSDFPNNIRILSWNYDYQFEIAFSEYSNQFGLDQNQSRLRVKSKNGDTNHSDGFGIFKLNGTTGLYENAAGMRQYLYTTHLNQKMNKNFFSEITRNFAAATYSPNIHSSLSFAWESENQNNSIVANSIETISDSIALVIIGYSFPFFNRDIDRKIIGSMKKLKRVYFQAPDANIIIERFQAIRDDLTGLELIPKFDLGQFVLPNEL